MPPSDRDPLAPQPSADSPPPAPGPSVFEPARAPVPLPPPLPAATPSPASPPPPFVPGGIPADDPTLSRRVPRWRWFASLLLIGFYPAFLSLLSAFLTARHPRAAGTPALPTTSRGLVLYVLLDLAVFGVLWGLAWLFSRATKDELLLRWRGGAFTPVWQGFAWSVGIRLILMAGVLFLAVLAIMALIAAGHDPKSLAGLVQANAPKTDGLFAPSALRDPLYLFLIVTLLSFAAAGGREELWRTACLAALRHLLPASWSDRARWGTSIALSSVIFGLGHVYQGALGVVMTGLIGAGLGVLTWRNRSIWPSVFAHGFFDATSFLMAAAVVAKKINLH